MSWDEETLREIERERAYRSGGSCPQSFGVYLELSADAPGRTIQVTQIAAEEGKSSRESR